MPQTSTLDGGVDVRAALIASGHAFTIVDAKAPDLPIVWANPAFETLTGYHLEDVAGRNCRLLQGPRSDREVITRIGDALRAGTGITETVLNYRKDGTTWWNEVTISPVIDVAGRVEYFVGVQSKVDDRVRASEQRDEARTAARIAEADFYAREHELALTLQRSLLPELPTVAGLELAARYVPASDSAEIGGDWYDVLLLPDGAIGVAIGDVMGHDMRAAGAMGQLRSVLRAYAWEGHGPAEVLDRLNELVCGSGTADLATCVYGRIERGRRGVPARFAWSNAGHLPPLLRTPDGSVQMLAEPSSVLIGVPSAISAIHQRRSGLVSLPPGSTLLLYTDGLIEDARRDITVELERLRKMFEDTPCATSVDDLADTIVERAGSSDLNDDQCLLVVRVGA